MAVTDDRVPPALDALLRREHLTGAVVLSTCMRTEVYAAAGSAQAAVADVRNFFHDRTGGEPGSDEDFLYSFCGGEAVSHLFRVASGIDSAILGKGEILRQVRKAWELAEQVEAAGPVLARLFRHSLEVGKRAHSETGICRGTTSYAQPAVSIAMEHFGSLQGRAVVVIGAGAMGRGVSGALTSVPGVEDIHLRQPHLEQSGRAGGVLRRSAGRPGPAGAGRLERADVLITSTAASKVLVRESDVRAVLPARNGRLLLVVDMAVPRDVDPAVAPSRRAPAAG
jgi:glutamyl-tRNA reductase